MLALTSRPVTASALAAALVAPLAHAEGWGGMAGLVSDRIYRGVSQTSGRAAVLLGARHVTDGGWSGTAEFATSGSDPIAQYNDMTLGVQRGWQLDGDWSVQSSYEHYAYSGSAQRRRYDRDELSASLNWQGRWFSSLTVSPNTTTAGTAGMRHTGVAIAVESGVRQRLVGRLAVDAGIGYDALRLGADGGYPYANVGLSSGIGPVQAYLSFITSQAAQRGLAPASIAGNRIAASLLWNF